jgi:hypothetical protein
MKDRAPCGAARKTYRDADAQTIFKDDCFCCGECGCASSTPSQIIGYAVSLYMTPVDAMDTMILMGLAGEAAEMKEFVVKNLSFDHEIEVKNFEIVIRLLGALLSNYQLTEDKRLLALADDWGTRLLPDIASRSLCKLPRQ